MPTDFPILVGDPPDDPRTISFHPSCFTVVGTRVEFVIVMSAPRYPERFTNREEAEVLSRKTGRPIVENVVQVRRRVSWTLPAATP